MFMVTYCLIFILEHQLLRLYMASVLCCACHSVKQIVFLIPIFLLFTHGCRRTSTNITFHSFQFMKNLLDITKKEQDKTLLEII